MRFLTPDPPLRNALYRNNRDGTFTDVAEKAGVLAGGYGWPDLYVTQYGRSILYHNNDNGRFTYVTEKASLAVPGWASSAVWFGYDNHGRLDLFVCRFVGFGKSKNKFCGNEKTGERFYCIPRIYPPAASWLFHNNGWMDLFVAKDTVANFLFVNKRNGKFEEMGLEAGVAYSQAGRERSGMALTQRISISHDLTFEDMAGPMGLGRLAGRRSEKKQAKGGSRQLSFFA